MNNINSRRIYIQKSRMYIQIQHKGMNKHYDKHKGVGNSMCTMYLGIYYRIQCDSLI